MEIHCSKCGEWDYDRLSSLVRKGWRTMGDAAYCPKCSPSLRYAESESKSLTRLADRADSELSSLRKKLLRRRD